MELANHRMAGPPIPTDEYEYPEYEEDPGWTSNVNHINFFWTALCINNFSKGNIYMYPQAYGTTAYFIVNFVLLF